MDDHLAQRFAAASGRTEMSDTAWSALVGNAAGVDPAAGFAILTGSTPSRRVPVSVAVPALRRLGGRDLDAALRCADGDSRKGVRDAVEAMVSAAAAASTEFVAPEAAAEAAAVARRDGATPELLVAAVLATRCAPEAHVAALAECCTDTALAAPARFEVTARALRTLHGPFDDELALVVAASGSLPALCAVALVLGRRVHGDVLGEVVAPATWLDALDWLVSLPAGLSLRTKAKTVDPVTVAVSLGAAGLLECRGPVSLEARYGAAASAGTLSGVATAAWVMAASRPGRAGNGDLDALLSLCTDGGRRRQPVNGWRLSDTSPALPAAVALAALPTVNGSTASRHLISQVVLALSTPEAPRWDAEEFFAACELHQGWEGHQMRSLVEQLPRCVSDQGLWSSVPRWLVDRSMRTVGLAPWVSYFDEVVDEVVAHADAAGFDLDAWQVLLDLAEGFRGTPGELVDVTAELALVPPPAS